MAQTGTGSSPLWWVGYARAQVAEIRRDAALRAAGACLALTYALSVLDWWIGPGAELVTRPDPVCWPALDVCHALRGWSLGQVHGYLLGLAGVSVACAALFTKRRTVPWAILLLLLAVVWKGLFMAMDYRTRLNQHYMAFLFTVVFLFVPRKRDALRLLLVLFYVWAATLKLNQEWISGAALYRPLWLIPDSLVSPACVYVIVLEVAVSWLLLTDGLWMWLALAQLLLFHLLSFAVVGFFYPSLMVLLLAVVPMCRLWPDPRTTGLARRVVTGRVHRAVYTAAILLSLAQLVPDLHDGDPSVTAEGRLWALHMFDARVTCVGYAEVRNAAGGSRVLKPSPSFRFSYRMGCDPNVFLYFARDQCGRGIDGFGEVVDARLHLESRKVTAGTWTTVVERDHVCSDPPSMGLWGGESWRP